MLQLNVPAEGTTMASRTRDPQRHPVTTVKERKQLLGAALRASPHNMREQVLYHAFDYSA